MMFGILIMEENIMFEDKGEVKDITAVNTKGTHYCKLLHTSRVFKPKDLFLFIIRARLIWQVRYKYKL